MAPGGATFSKNHQFNVFEAITSTSCTNNTNASNSSRHDKNNNDDSGTNSVPGNIAIPTFEELTKDLVLMEDNEENVPGEEQPTQELDWNFDDGDDTTECSNPENHDNDEEENDASSIGEKISPFSGRKKAQQITSPKNALATNYKESHADDSMKATVDNKEKNETSTIGSEDSDVSDGDDDESNDDNTVAMSKSDESDQIQAVVGPPSSSSKANDQVNFSEDEHDIDISSSKANDQVNFSEDENDIDASFDGSDGADKKLREIPATPESDGRDAEEAATVPTPALAGDDADVQQGWNGSDEVQGVEATLKDDQMDGSSRASVLVETPRRSTRTRKPKSQFSANETSLKAESNRKRIPTKKVWTAAVDELYSKVEDKNKVTVKNIKHALVQMFDCKMNAKWGADIKARLHDLVNQKIQMNSNDEDNGSTADADQEDADDESSVASDYVETASGGSDNEDDAKKTSARKRKSSNAKRRENAKNKKTRRPPKFSKRKAARAAKVMEMQKLRRKQRIEELKVRNEEMQLNQSKEDQERAEAIAAKFETNTDELRLKRLEDRLDLLEKLDQKRISIVDIDEEKEKHEPATQQTLGNDQSESEEFSEEEKDLIIVGMKRPFKPLKPLHNHLPSSGLDVLNGVRSPDVQKCKARQAHSTAWPVRAGKSEILLSPSRSTDARLALRNALKQKQRNQGNLWLARELGYKREEDHVNDCKIAAQQKREIVIKLEQERLKANERKNLRERLLLQDANGIEEDEEQPVEDEEHAEDEELQLAKEIEQESICRDPIIRKAIDNGTECSDSDVDQPLKADSTSPEEGRPCVTNDENGTDDMNGFSQDDSIDQNVDNSRTTHDVVTSIETSSQIEVEPICTGRVQINPDCLDINEPQNPEIKMLEAQSVTSENRSRPDDVQKSYVDRHCEASPVSSPNKLEHVESETIEKSYSVNDNDKSFNPEGKRNKNSMWKEMLKREEQRLKKQKKRRGDLVEEEAEEEEEEEVAGLEDFGFTISKKNKDEEEDDDDPLNEDDLEHIVDEVSDGEGDEEAGMAARRRMEAQEEKRRHKEYLRRTREGYDGRRGGIAGGSSGARGLHGFDQLVAPDNREDAKRLGLLNDDELDSDAEKDSGPNDDEEDDEAALLDEGLKRRHLHQSDVDLEDHYSSADDAEEESEIGNANQSNDSEAEEERSQRRLNQLFKKRATMHDYEHRYGNDEEFSQQRLIDEDTSMKEELQKMRNGLVRKRSASSGVSQSSFSSDTGSRSAFFWPQAKRVRSTSVSVSSRSGGSLSVALFSSQTAVRRTSFLGKPVTSESTELVQCQSFSIGRASLQNQSSFGGSGSNNSKFASGNKIEVTRRKAEENVTASLFSRVVGRG